MTIGILQEENLEKQIVKQMGCMAGFLQIFDRHQIPNGRRLYSTKRLPSSSASETSEEEKAVESPLTSRELEKQPQGRLAPSPDRSTQSPVILDRSNSQWKFSRKAPRLSLDSRAVFDAKGSLKPREIHMNQCQSNNEDNGMDDNDNDKRQSPSVIARLMGLGSLPNSDPEPNGKAELRRSASEARGRDLFQYRFIDGVNFHLKQSQQSNLENKGALSNVVRENGAKHDYLLSNRPESLRNARAEQMKAPVRGMGQRKCFYDSADFFPEPKQNVSIYGEIDKRLKLRGINESSEDIEILKQILEALQLKGLLHSRKPPNQTNNRNFVYEHEQSPITVIKPRSQARRIGNDSPPSRNKSRHGPRRNLSIEVLPAMSPRRDRSENDLNQRKSRGSISPARSGCGMRSPNRKPLSVETQRRGNGNVEQRRVSPVQSPRVNVRKTGFDHTTIRSPRNRKSTAEVYQKEEKVTFIPTEDETSTVSECSIRSTAEVYQKEEKVTFIPTEDETSTVSECSISTCSQNDSERSKEGRSLLERCDKLLHSIAEMTATTELQPSPVSVLDSSFYEESSLSPVRKRSIDFKEDETRSPTALSSDESKSEYPSDFCDFIYISDILRASNYLPDNCDLFVMLEKQQQLKGKDTSKVSRLLRKLKFDTINEILNRKRQLPAWKVITSTNSGSGEASLQEIWSEFQKIRERDSSDDLFEVICGVLRKDLAGDAINGWGDYSVQMSESVLDIERQIYKDLIVETIHDLAAFSRKSNKIPALRRKLVF